MDYNSLNLFVKHNANIPKLAAQEYPMPTRQHGLWYSIISLLILIKKNPQNKLMYIDFVSMCVENGLPKEAKELLLTAQKYCKCVHVTRYYDDIEFLSRS